MFYVLQQRFIASEQSIDPIFLTQGQVLMKTFDLTQIDVFSIMKSFIRDMDEHIIKNVSLEITISLLIFHNGFVQLFLKI